MTKRTATHGDITARYEETATERVLSFERQTDAGRVEAVVAQNRQGYAMLAVKRTLADDELERYYGFEMALDHAAELLGVQPSALPIPDEATDMGM